MLEDKEIFEICSPYTPGRRLLKGPYYIVYKDPSDEYAIVAIDYRVSENLTYVPCLGIRWMADGNGMPCRGKAKMWFVLPNNMHDAILGWQNINKANNQTIEQFLQGKITGKDLMKYYFKNGLNDQTVSLSGDVICDSTTNKPIQPNRFNP